LSVGVFDEKGEPIREARITVEGYGTSVLKTTDDTGALVVFEQLAEGAYQVHVEAEGLRDAQRRVDLKAGDNHLEVTLQAASMLSGTVVDAEGKPVPSATVELVSQIHEAQATSTNDDGTFELQVDEPGDYRVRAREPQLGQVTKDVTAPASGVVLKLDAMGRIEVRVTADKNPVRGAYVSVYGTGPSSDDSGSASTDDRGVARLAGLLGGSYMVNVEQSGYQRVTPQMVKLAPGGKAEVTIALDRGVEIVGRVVDETGKPVPNTDVHTVAGDVKVGDEAAAEVEAAASTYSDENGEFRLEGLKPGHTYTIAATADDRATKAPVKVKAPASGVTVKVEPLPGVKGRVIDETGSPVLAFRVDGREFDTRDGRFTIGREADSEGKIYLSVDAEGFEALTVEQPFTDDLGNLTLKKAPLLRGVVVDANGQPVSGADVTCDQCIDSTISAADGTFTLPVSQDSPEPTITASRLNHRGKTKVTGTAGAVTVKLEGPVRVEGIVKDPAGRPISARITVREINGAAEERLDSGPDGKFELDVPEGLWMFITRMSSNGQTVKVVPPKTFVTLGAPPGTCAITITVAEPVGDAWLVPGEPERVPLEQLDDDALYAGAVALDLPLPNRPTRSAGLTCGVYTLITTDSSGVRRERVDVRAPESSYFMPPGPPEPAGAGVPGQP
ncbi:MAG: carboxypeptidase regulatory-like domain-containing protein, partial [Myxococcaceae bacterium]|nr:carboxypeptidase regulatory-like domain-containing protein [Myxococcaceae bacterium]